MFACFSPFCRRWRRHANFNAGNYYSIENDYDQPARIFFSQGCEMAPRPMTDEDAGEEEPDQELEGDEEEEDER